MLPHLADMPLDTRKRADPNTCLRYLNKGVWKSLNTPPGSGKGSFFSCPACQFQKTSTAYLSLYLPPQSGPKPKEALWKPPRNREYVWYTPEKISNRRSRGPKGSMGNVHDWMKDRKGSLGSVYDWRSLIKGLKWLTDVSFDDLQLIQC